MELYRLYLKIYLGCLIIFLLSIVLPYVEYLYAGIFFVSGMALIFTYQKPTEDPEHSTVTHFQYESRYTRINFIIAGILIISALACGFLPFHKGLIAFICWSVLAFVINYYSQRIVLEITQKLLTDYLSAQLPQLDSALIHRVIETLHTYPHLTAANISAQFRINNTDSEKLLHLYRTYLQNNALGF